MTHWNQIIISFDSIENDFVDYVSFLLFEIGAQGTEIKYAPGYLENHPNLFGEIPLELPENILEKQTQVLGSFSEELDKKTIISYLKKELKKVAPENDITIDFATVENENWQSNWMKHYKIQHITRYLKVVPVWEEYQSSSAEQIIYLDPGVAFGTGDHPTTQLGVQALEIVMRGGETVLDVGTGSGVLSFAAHLLGAEKVYGYDLDPQAVTAAKENLKYQPTIQKLIETKTPEAEVPIQFQENNLLSGVEVVADIIVANILPHILVDMFPDAYRLLETNGFLILGGILKEKISQIEAVINPKQWEEFQRTQYKGWVSIIYQKKVGD